MSYASAAIKRLSNEYRHLQKEENRVSDFFVAPLEENIFEWHFTLRGPAGDDNNLPYRDGLYHGALLFSRSYPLEPPDIMFFTRSGRFATHEKICSTISSFHKELWQPTYDVALTLTALRHFMAQEEEFGIGAFPKNMVAVETKVAWAKESRGFTCSSCGCATLEVWETKMKMYPETSAEKTALVPKLPPSSNSAPSAAAAASTPDAEAEAGTTTTAVAGEETATPAPAETASEKKATVEAEAGRAVSGTPANTVEATPAAVVAPAAAAAPSPPLKAVSASVPADVHTRASPPPPTAAAVTESAPAAPSPPVPPAASASAQDRQTDGMGQHTSDVHRSDQEDATAAHAWQSASFHYAAYDYGNAYDDDDDEEDSYGLDEDGYPRCYLTSLPLLNEEEARQLANADMSSGIPDIRFESVLRAAIRRDEHERAVAAALAAGDAPPPPPPPPPTPPGMFPGSHEMLPEELLAHLLPLHAQEDLVTPLIAPEIAAAVAAAAAEAAAEQRPAPPPPPQLAENLVFAIHTYRVSVPLRLVDRAILWSFAVAVFILLRRAVWSFVMGMWS